MTFFTNVVNISKELCTLKVKKGDKVVDGTMGNGNDTAFLCDLVGEGGKVYAFDIQVQAIINTTKKLEALNLLDRAELILDGHENLNKYIKHPIKLAIFNLGYLPNTSHEITTKKETTLQAVQQCLSLLEPDGLLLLIIYPGHESGKLEQEALKSFSEKLDQKKYNVVNICFANQINNPPELICIEKR